MPSGLSLRSQTVRPGEPRSSLGQLERDPGAVVESRDVCSLNEDGLIIRDVVAEVNLLAVA
jgi:hypothetical protein